jgi:hypothetical protein
MTPINQIFAQQQTAQELRDQIRTSVQEQIRNAQQQRQAGGPFVIVSKDGKVTSIENVVPPGTPEASVVPAREFIRGLDVPPRAQNVAFAFLFTIGAMVIFTPIARAIARVIDRRSERPQIPAQVTAQLTQLTQAVDSIAIEVERISEGQRFTTKLLAEQQKATKELHS